MLVISRKRVAAPVRLSSSWRRRPTSRFCIRSAKEPSAAGLETQTYIARKTAEGKTQREAILCLKRHLARRIWHLLQPPTANLATDPPLSIP
jgi:hypothetical protein